MKKIFTLLFFVTIHFTAKSQFVAVNQVDEFTKNHIIKVTCTKGEKWKQSDDIAKGLFNQLYLSSKYIKTGKSAENILFTTIGIPLTGTTLCLAKGKSIVIFLFENSETMELSLTSETNCSSTALEGNFDLNPTQLDYLSQNKIKKIRVYLSESYLEYEIIDDKKPIIMKHYAMLMDEYKKLNP